MQGNEVKLIRSIAFIAVLVAVLSPMLPSVSAADTKAIVRANLTNIVMLIALDSGGQPKAIGSGFFVGENGEVASNYHVVEDAASVVVKLIGSDKSFPVLEVLRADAEADLVVLKVNTKSVPVRFGRDEALEVGDRLVAIGNPEGLEGTVSEGIVSGFRKVSETNRLIQITAPISPGSSGGPVFNASGEVVGVASSTLTEGQNLNFAIPSSKLNELLRKPALNVPLSDVRKVVGGRRRLEGFRDTSELVRVVDYRCLNNGVKFSIFNGTDKPIANVKLIAKFYRTQWSNQLQRTIRVGQIPTHFGAFKVEDAVPSKLSKSIEKYDREVGYQWEAEFQVLDFTVLPASTPIEFK